MKKFFSALLVVFMLGVALQSVSAETCNIKGSNGDTVQVFSSNLGSNSVDITLGSDSQYPATIDVSVTVTYTGSRGNRTRSYSKKCIASPGQTTPLTIDIDPSINENGWIYTPASYTISLTGTKCE